MNINQKSKIKNQKKGKIILSIFTFSILFFTFITSVYAAPAATTTPAPSGANNDKAVIGDKLNSEINQLKEKIASRVSELNLVEKRGIIGTVQSSSSNALTLTDVAGNTRNVDVDEITKFSSPSAKAGFGLSDLTKGTKVSVLGLYNKQSKRILARFISTSVDPVFLSGEIASKDKPNLQVTITTEDQKDILIDIQPSTKLLTSTEDGMTAYGFSKINNGDRVYIIGYPSKTKSSMIEADRLIDIPTLPKNKKIILPDVDNNASNAATQTTPAPAGKTLK